MLTSILLMFLGQIAVLLLAYAIEPKSSGEMEMDMFYLRRLDLYPEFLDEWERTVDAKIFSVPVAPQHVAIPVIDGNPALLSDHFLESKAFYDEWEAEEAYASACACEVGCQDTWSYWEGKGGWFEGLDNE